MHEPDYKWCPTCRKLIKRRANERPSRWREKRFCSPGCSKVSPCKSCGERKPKAPAASNQNGRGMAGLCVACYRAALKTPNYGSGRSESLRSGYIRIWDPQHPLAGADGYVYEHRRVWFAARGDIPAGYHIHHINRDKRDNRIENLELLSPSEHSTLHAHD